MSKQQDRKEQPNEQRFNILPHPAKTNNPADLTRPGDGGEMPSIQDRMTQLATGARGPHILSEEQKSGLEQPLTHEELRVRAAQLNK